MLRNNKGSYMALIMGMAIVLGGAFVYILLDVTMTGGGTGTGFIYAAENTSNISTTNPTYANLNAMWVYGVPLALLIAGLLKVLISSQKREGAF
jgi:hypothetical protein